MEFTANFFYYSSSSSSSIRVAEKDFLRQMLEKNYEDSGLDVSLTLAPPAPPVKRCCLCGETKTPLWRSGPHGPKSVCNACGIRYRKDQTKINTDLTLTMPTSQSSSAVMRSEENKYMQPCSEGVCFRGTPCSCVSKKYS